MLVKWIGSAPVKTDPHDTLKLARLLAAGMLPTVWVPPAPVRALRTLIGQYNLCVFAPTCGEALALEHNGNLYSCDHFVEPAYLLGNIRETPMLELVAGDKQRRFGRDKYESLPRYCRKCDVLSACYGECHRNRFVKTPGGPSSPGGQDGLNYLCAGYQLFFRHVREPMTVMANLLREGRPADAIMDLFIDLPSTG